MVSRRVFLKNGAFALVSLGFAPSFLTRTAYAQGPVRARETAHRDLPARRRRRPQRRRAVRRQRILPRAADHRHRAAEVRRGRRDRSRRLLRLQPAAAAAQAVLGRSGAGDRARVRIARRDALALRRAGLHGDRDARDVKSTPDGWLNRYLQARNARRLGRLGEPTPFRAVSLTQQLPRMLQGAGACAGHESDQPVRHPRRPGATGASFEAQYAAAADRVLNGTGREAFDAIKMLKAADPASYQPENGADYPRSPFGQALKQIGQLTKADVGLEVAFADVGGWDTHVNQGSSQGQLANRLDDFGRGLAALVTDLGSRMADTVILTMSEFGQGGRRERQSRNRPRTRQRDDGDRRRRARRQGLRQVAGTRARASGTRAATWPSRPISATSSARSSSATWASAIRGRSFRATPSTREVSGLFA